MSRAACRRSRRACLGSVIVLSLLARRMWLARDFERSARFSVPDSTSDFAARFRVPVVTSNITEDKSFLLTWKGLTSFRKDYQGLVRYVRPETAIIAVGSSRTCAQVLDVLAALFATLSLREEHEMMLAYGGLIHIHRDKDFVNKTNGKYFDDDIDVWVNGKAMASLVQLEPILFNKFGWTVRLYTVGSYIVFAQILATCGHTPMAKASKVRANEPAVDVYPLSEAYKDDRILLKDLWQGTTFSETMMYPTKPYELISHIATQPIRMQMPAKDEEIMSCLYGNWKVHSKKHARRSLKCATASDESSISNGLENTTAVFTKSTLDFTKEKVL